MKNNIFVFAFLIINCYQINAGDSLRNRFVEKTLKDKEIESKEPDFFKRSEKRRAFERCEYKFTPENLNFFLSHNHLDPKIFGCNTQNSKEFSHQLQATTAKVIQKDEFRKHELSEISNHAIPQCNLCADLELKRRRGQDLGTVPTATTLYIIWPYTRGDANIFYKNACGDFYKKLSDEKLEQIIKITK